MVKENCHLVFFCLVAYILSASDFFYVNSLGAEHNNNTSLPVINKHAKVASRFSEQTYKTVIIKLTSSGMSGHKPAIFLDTESTVSCSFTVPRLII